MIVFFGGFFEDQTKIYVLFLIIDKECDVLYGGVLAILVSDKPHVHSCGVS